MLIPRRILLSIGLLAWGTAALEFFLPAEVRIRALAEVGGFDLFSFSVSNREAFVVFGGLLGLAAGLFVGGVASDRFGRFRVLLWSMVLAPVFSFLSGIAFSLIDFYAMRFLVGLSCGGILVSSTILIFEGFEPKTRSKALLVLPAAAFLGIMAAFLVWLSTAILPFESISHWRCFLFLTILPAALVFPFYQYHDEPLSWKVLVRDSSGKKSFSRSTSLTDPRHRFALLYGFVLASAVSISLIGIVSHYSYLRAEEIRRLNLAGGRYDDDRRDDAALIAYLLRYPQLLTTKEFENLDFDPVMEKIFHSPGHEENLPLLLMKSLASIRSEQKPIDRESLVDRALALQVRNDRETDTSAHLPLSTLDVFSQSVWDYLDYGESWLESEIVPDEEQASGFTRGEIWVARRTELNLQLNRLNERFLRRETMEVRQCLRNDFLLLLGGVVGVLLFLKTVEYSGLWKASIGGFIFVLVFVAAFFGFLFRPDGLAFSGGGALRFTTFLLGLGTFYLLGIFALMIPPLFSLRRRAAGTGLAFGAALFFSLFLSLLSKNETIGFGWILFALVAGSLICLYTAFGERDFEK